MQIPLARRMMLLSVNQTILFALSMVVIAGLIGGAGLGDAVTNGLYTDPVFAIFAGAAIVIMAIALDRSTEAMANRTDPAKRHLTTHKAHVLRAYTAFCVVSVVVTAVLSHVFNAGTVWSRWTAQDWLRNYVQNGLDYIQNPNTFLFRDLTNPTGNFIVAARDPAAADVLHRDAVAGDARRARGDRLPDQRPAPRGDRRADALHRRLRRRVAERDGHLLPGARRDRR